MEEAIQETGSMNADELTAILARVEAGTTDVQDAERLRELFEIGAGQNPGVLPLYIDNGEIIFCSAISGGANYVDGMPAELQLTRQLPDGTTIHRRYVQKGNSNG